MQKSKSFFYRFQNIAHLLGPKPFWPLLVIYANILVIFKEFWVILSQFSKNQPFLKKNRKIVFFRSYKHGASFWTENLIWPLLSGRLPPPPLPLTQQLPNCVLGPKRCAMFVAYEKIIFWYFFFWEMVDSLEIGGRCM